MSDIWRARNPRALQFSCYSSSCATLSRIDLVLGNELASQVINDVVYQPRGVSDHSLLIISVKPGYKKSCRVWKMNPAWLEIIEGQEVIVGELKEFITFNADTTSRGVMWDALKAYLRGSLIQKVSNIKKVSRDWEDRFRKELVEAEREYMKEPSPEKQRVWENNKDIKI